VTTITLPSPCLVVLVGVAGSGKSTWAARNFEASHIVSSDAIRALVGEGEGDQAASKDAFAILDEVVERRPARKLTTVINTLGLDPKRRQAYRTMAAHAALPCVAVAIEVDPARVRRFDFPGGPAEVGERLSRIVQTAECCGFESVWVMDHFRMPPQVGRAWDDMLESYTTLAFLAARTTTIRLGTLVTGITYRNVAHLGKIVATLDVLSGGRANCGIGLGWFKQEHEGYGWVLPSVAERYALVEDALTLLPQMWGPGNRPFAGTVLSVPDTTCYPRPLQAHIPLLLGGSGEHRMLRLVARYADACNLFGEAPELRRKIDALLRHCDDAGRDPADIDVTHLSSVLVADTTTELASLIERRRPRSMSAERFARSANAGTIGQHVDRLANLSGAGVQLEIVSLSDLQGPEQIERFGDVIDAFR